MTYFIHCLIPIILLNAKKSGERYNNIIECDKEKKSQVGKKKGERYNKS